MSKKIEIFRAGRHTAMNGTTITFTAADIAAMANGYDRSLFDAPLVVGHPQQDAPAYGWTGGLSVEGDTLLCDPTDVDPAFAELVTAKRFKKISAAFYAPDDENNPKPGQYYLRHVGFLGAAAPAVKGLKDATFAGDANKVLEFADSDVSWALTSIASAMRGFRDWLIGEKGLDTANQVMPDWNITSIEDAATRLRPADNNLYTEHKPEIDPTMKTAEQREADLTARETALAAREAKVTTSETAFAESARKARGTADAALLEVLIADGRLVPAQKAPLLRFMATLDGEKTLAFAEGADAPQLSAHAFFTDLLASKTGKVIHFGEVSKPGEGAEDRAADPEVAGAQIARQALAYVETQKKAGITITIDQAVDHIRSQEAK